MTYNPETTKRQRPRIGERVIHEGISTSCRYDSDGNQTITEKHYRDVGILLDIDKNDDRCTVRFDDGVTVDNIYIGDLVIDGGPTHWCSVVTPDRGVVEYCLPRFVRDMKPEHHAAYRTLYDLSRQYKTKVEFSDHPIKYGAPAEG